MIAKICPRCHSLHIRIRWQSFWFAGFPATYECLDCGFKSFIFPRAELTKANVKKLIKLRKKSLKAKIH
jgi:ssDNA-binding Zn-finger/Zn-ribbon topoisomerase 1